MNLRAKLAAAAVLSSMVGAAHALAFQLTFTPGTSDVEKASFQAAADLWSARFADPVTVKLTVGTAALGPGILGQAASRRLNTNFTNFKAALGADITTQADVTAVGNLGLGASTGMLINRTSNNPNGSGSATPYLDNDGDANNQTIRLTAANARSLGFSFGIGGIAGACTDCDAFIQFSTNFTWDHDRSNGINPTDFDFVGVAAHEIGHALGFVSGVDTLDGNSPPVNGPFPDDAFTFVSSLDLFRWSDLSALSGVQDFTADTRDKFFTIDRGATREGLFSNGVNFGGDGRQASHWRDSMGIGIMDPTSARGELLAISALDLKAFDVIGWNFLVPLPSTVWLAGLGFLGLMGLQRRRAR